MYCFILAATVVSGFLTAGSAGAADWAALEEALGTAGETQPDDVYKVTLPRSDLEVTADGVRVKPAFALTSWLAFRETGERVVMTGDLVLLEDELNPVLTRLAAGGLRITAIHHHLNNLSPDVIYVHVGDEGDAAALADAVRAALEEMAPLGRDRADEPEQDLGIDLAALDKILGHSGTANGGVYKFSIPRPEEVRLNGAVLPSAMGTATAISFQPTDRGAAVTGDFVMTSEEIDPVIEALREHGIEVMALHNHMLREEPRLFFMHFWGHGAPQELARGLRAGLDSITSEGR